MGKIISRWAVTSLIIGFLLYFILSLVTRTTFGNIFGEFEILLMLTGFSTSIATTLTCTKLILDKINTNRLN